MNTFGRLGIRGRLVIAHVLVLIVLLTALGVYLQAGARGTLEKSRLDELGSAAALIGLAVGDELPEPAAFAEIVRRSAAPGLAAVLLADDGSIVAEAGWPMPPGLRLPWPSVRLTPAEGFAAADAGRMAWALRGLDAATGGAVAVVGDTAEIDRTLGELTGVLALSFVVFTAAGASAIWWLTGRALAPVRRLAEASSRIAAGEIGARVPPDTGADELAGVGRAFNAMAAQVERTAERQRGFMADAAHELRTPLAAVVGSLDVLEQADAGDAARLRTTMRAQLARLSRMVDDLMFLARADALGTPAFDASRVDLALIARDAVDEARHLPEARGAELRMRATGATVVHGTADALHRLLLNLLVNALRHGAPPIDVTLSRIDGTVSCEIRDAGPGIRDDLLPHAFERFRRGASDDRGSGLGLAIARAITDAHGGTLTVRNEAGAVVTLQIPAA